MIFDGPMADDAPIDDGDEPITRRDAQQLVEYAISAVFEALASRRNVERWTTGVMASTTTVELDDDPGVPLAAIGTATAGARVLVVVVPPTAVYVIRTL